MVLMSMCCKDSSSPFSISLRLINGRFSKVIKGNHTVVSYILTESYCLIQLIALQFDNFAEDCTIHH
jgi:hypothetical protein